MMAPFTPFVAERIYQDMFRPAEPKSPATIHALDWPRPRSGWRNEKLERSFEVSQRIVSAASMARMKASLKLRQPVRTVTVITGDDDVREAVFQMKPLLLDQLNARSLNVVPPSESKDKVVLRVVPNMAALGPELKSNAAKAVENMMSMDPMDLRERLKTGKTELQIDSNRVTIYDRYVSFVEETKGDQPTADFEGGRVLIDTTLSADEVSDGLARDLVRRIQQMRKEMDLKVDAFVDVDISASTVEAVSSMQGRKGYIAGEVRAKRLMIHQTDPRKDMGNSLEIGRLRMISSQLD